MTSTLTEGQIAAARRAYDAADCSETDSPLAIWAAVYGEPLLAFAAQQSQAAADREAAGYDKAVRAILSWADGMYAADSRARLRAVAQDLITNRTVILAALEPAATAE